MRIAAEVVVVAQVDRVDQQAQFDVAVGRRIDRRGGVVRRRAGVV